MPGPAPTPSAFQFRPWLLGLVLVAAVIFTLQPAWHAGFIWDDDDYVTNNPLLSAPDGLWRIWFSTDSPSQYFPLTYSTFRLEYALWGLNPAGYHWFNILLHAVNALLVWRLLQRLALPGAWLAAAIFALHPVQVESVAWITELKNIQSLFFFLLALLAWIHFTERPYPKTSYLLALLLHALALLSKTTACTLPAALILTLWLTHQPITARRWLQVSPFILLSLAMGLLTVWWERHHQGTSAIAFSYDSLDRLLIASRALCFYLGKFLWPVDLTFNYPLWAINATAPVAYAWFVLFLLLTSALLLLRQRLGRGPESAFVFFAATLSPLLGFIMLYTFKYTFVADHYAYTALIAPAALSAAALHSLPTRWLRPALASALLLTLASHSFRQAQSYSNLETLWQSTIAKNPNSYMGHNNLGTIRLSQGRLDEAITHFQTALVILPDHGNAHGNLAYALLKKNRTDEALSHFRRAVELEPQVAKAHSDLAHGLFRTNHFDAAIASAKNALLLDPDFAEAHYNLALALFQKQQLDDSLFHFQLAAALQPNNTEFLNNLGWALLQDNQPAAAAERFRTVLQLQPDFTLARYNLALAAQHLGTASDFPAAVSATEQALKSASSNRDAPLATALKLQLTSLQTGEPFSTPLPMPPLSP